VVVLLILGEYIDPVNNIVVEFDSQNHSTRSPPPDAAPKLLHGRFSRLDTTPCSGLWWRNIARVFAVLKPYYS
jgi:hypothetical protein